MKRSRAERFPEQSRIKFLDWEINSCGEPIALIHVSLSVPGNQQPVHVVFADPEEAYDFAQDILKAYDYINGI